MTKLRWRSLTIGGAAFAASHVVVVSKWTTWFGGGAWEPWFLNDGGRAVLFTALCLFAAALIVSLLWARGALDSIVHGLNVAAGAAAAMIVVLAAFVGLGTIFPIVLAAGGLVAFASTFVASVLAAVIGRRSI
jgi:hypothetical protein